MTDPFGAWKYEHRNDEIRYGGEVTYRRAAAFLDDCGPVVEDWGCGGAYAKKFITKSRYLGIDGSGGRCDLVADLRVYTSDADGILIRHILEHNHDWPMIVMNACKSFRERMAVVFFIEPGQYTRNAFDEANGIPNLSIGMAHLMRYLPGSAYDTKFEKVEDKDTSPAGAEWILFAERR